jgi:hypothetical protein
VLLALDIICNARGDVDFFYFVIIGGKSYENYTARGRIIGQCFFPTFTLGEKKLIEQLLWCLQPEIQAAAVKSNKNLLLFLQVDST